MLNVKRPRHRLELRLQVLLESVFESPLMVFIRDLLENVLPVVRGDHFGCHSDGSGMRGCLRREDCHILLPRLKIWGRMRGYLAQWALLPGIQLSIKTTDGGRHRDQSIHSLS